jgi:hypothetical protein
MHPGTEGEGILPGSLSEKLKNPAFAGFVFAAVPANGKDNLTL